MKSSERGIHKKDKSRQPVKKLYLSNDFSLDLMDFSDENEALDNNDQTVNRNYFRLLLSLIKYNNTLCFFLYREKSPWKMIEKKINENNSNQGDNPEILISEGNSENSQELNEINNRDVNQGDKKKLPKGPIGNNIFTRVAVLLISFSLYLFINIIFMTDDSSLHLYTGKGLSEKSEPKKYFINLFLLPLIVYIITQIFRKKLSVIEFYFQQIYNIGKIYDIYKNNNFVQILRLHNVETEISKFKDEMESKAKKVFMFGSILLFFNWYMVVCFNGIYTHSLDCVLSNTFNSIFFALLITLALFLISSLLRKISRGKNKKLYKLSQWMNPSYWLYAKGKSKKEKEEEENNNKEGEIKEKDD